MSMARHRASGESPEKVYIVVVNGSHRLYSSKSSAKGVLTNCRKWNYEKDAKLFEGTVTEWVEVND